MSMEHIFRNLNDIRVFDLFDEMMISKDESIDIHRVIELLECGEAERIQIEDSINHLVREQILSIELVDEKWTSGCESCGVADRQGWPRLPGHESHKPLIKGTSKIEHYYLSDNKMVICLTVAIMESSFLKADKIREDKGE